MMKKTLTFLLILISVNATSQLSNETRQLFYDNKISTMSLGLIFCNKAVENVSCNFNSKQEQIIIYAEYPSGWKSNLSLSEIELCGEVMKSDRLKRFEYVWMQDNKRIKRRATYFLKNNPFLETFYEDGIFTMFDGKNSTEAITDWFVKNLRLVAYIGDVSWGESDKKSGLVCTFKMFQDKDVSVRKDNYQGFLIGLDN